MKTVLFMRHAKSDWKAPFGSDHERPLNQRGMRAARVMGRFLALTGQTPDRAVTSTAVRARTTLELAIEAGAWKCDVQQTDDLYQAHPGDVVDLIRAEDAAADSLLIVGHEPTTSEVVRLLCGQGLPSFGSPVRFPTAAMGRVNLDIASWRGCEFGRGQLVWLTPPKLFTKGDFDFVS